MSYDPVTRTCPDCCERITADATAIEIEMRRHRAWCTPGDS